MESIAYSTNWNNKLSCPAHTTIRLHNPSKYIVGEKYEELFNRKKLQDVTIIEIKTLWLHQINDFIAYLDTGYSAIECREIIRKMYPNVDFNRTKLDFILLVVDKNTIEAVNEVIAAFCKMYEDKVGIKYKVTAAESGKIKGIEVTSELLRFYFDSTDFKLKEKSISNLVKYHNYIRQLIAQPELAMSSKFPNTYNAQFAAKLTGKELGEYFKHLISLGLTAKKDRIGNIIDFIKEQSNG